MREVDAQDAPEWFTDLEASAWACGYNAAVAKINNEVYKAADISIPGPERVAASLREAFRNKPLVCPVCGGCRLTLTGTSNLRCDDCDHTWIGHGLDPRLDALRTASPKNE